MSMDACSLMRATPSSSVVRCSSVRLASGVLTEVRVQDSPELFSTVKYKAVTLCPGGMARTQASSTVTPPAVAADEQAITAALQYSTCQKGALPRLKRVIPHLCCHDNFRGATALRKL